MTSLKKISISFFIFLIMGEVTSWMAFNAGAISKISIENATNYSDLDLPGYIISPYFGYVLNPNKPIKYVDTVNQFGFLDNPIASKKQNTLNVVLTGGSVAFWIGRNNKTYIEKKLSNIFKKKINLILLALPGYKQPQQLLTISYFKTLGGILI